MNVFTIKWSLLLLLFRITVVLLSKFFFFLVFKETCSEAWSIDQATGEAWIDPRQCHCRASKRMDCRKNGQGNQGKLNEMQWMKWMKWMKWGEGNTHDLDQWSFWKISDSVSCKKVSVCRGEIKPLCLLFWVVSGIGHFQLHLSLYFKASLYAKSLLWISVFIHIEIRTSHHNKYFALTVDALWKRD